MAIGRPDWNLTNAARTIFPVADLGEAAVRLGSIVTYDRRGDVVWFDDFEATLNKWQSGGSGTGNAQEISTTWARNGAQSCKLTAGSDVSRSAQIIHYQAFLIESKFGLEVSFMLTSQIDNLRLQSVINDGTTAYTFTIEWDDVDNALRYEDENGDFQTFASSVIFQSVDSLFHTWKLVIDGVNKEYVRFLGNEQEHDLSGLAPNSSPTVVNPRLVANIILTGRSGQNDVMYADDVILTQNEP